MAELRIPIIGEFKGQKAFNQAGKATSTLEKGVKRLGGALAATFGAQQLLKFAKNAAKAFIEDEQAAVRLAQSVKNLGLAFETPRIEEFISQLSKASGVTDDQLRPAMQKLLQTTGSVAKSTELLTQALDISRGSGVDYETVVEDLTKAYVGQTKGLNKYKLGLTKAELATMSFTDIQKQLGDQFKGSNAAYLETFAGKMGVLSTAAGEAKEIIGKGLIDALMILSGDTTIDQLAISMQTFATNTANVIVEIGKLASKLKNFATATSGPEAGFAGQITDFLDRLTGNEERIAERARIAAIVRMGGYPSSALGPMPEDPNAAARRKAEEEAAKRAKQLAAMQAKSLALQKKNLSLQKASKTLNLDLIGIEAALKGKISETDRISLELQKAILEGNGTLAEKLAKDLEAAVKRNNELKLALLATPEAPNPYRNWKIPNLGPIGGALGLEDLRGQGAVIPSFNDMGAGAVGGALGLEDLRGRSAAVPQINITVELDGQTVGGAIRDGQINDSLSGSFSQTNRFGAKGAIAL
jgi:hypothetical protein